MSKWAVLTGVAALFALGACDVQVHDQTPATFPANNLVGMYEVKASVSRDALVTPGSVYLFALGGPQRVEMMPDKQGVEWTGFYPVKCRGSFPLQFQVIWKRQGLSTGSKRVPPQPRQVQLTPPPLTKEATIDTSAKSNKGWEGDVPYQFVTAEHSRITAAHIEPLSQDAADVAAAKPILVASSFPIEATCGMPAEVHLSSKVAKAQGNLVIDTDLPGLTHWQTKVVFAPNASK